MNVILTANLKNKTAVPPMTDDAIGPDNSLLIVDDDGPFIRRLAKAMEARGFAVESAESVSEGISRARARPPQYAVVDLRLGDGNGLDVIAAIRQNKVDARVIVLTGYGNIATAVNAVKLGAEDYLAKPADADEIYAALVRSPGDKVEPPENPMSADRCGGNIFSVFMKCATAMFPRQRGGSTCIAVRYSASLPSARRSNRLSLHPMMAVAGGRTPGPVLPSEAAAPRYARNSGLLICARPGATCVRAPLG